MATDPKAAAGLKNPPPSPVVKQPDQVKPGGNPNSANVPGYTPPLKSPQSAAPTTQPPPTATPGAKLAAGKPSIETIVRSWAESLSPQNAPHQKDMGHLAWVRNTRVQELLNELAKHGYR